MKQWKIALTVFCLDWLLMSGSYTLMFPFLPVYLQNDLGCPKEDLTFWSSACFSIQFVFSCLLSPVWGKIADRFGRKLMLLRASSMLAISYCFCIFVQTPLQLFFARCFMGFACGITPVLLAMASETVPKEKTGFTMGLLQSMNILGTVIGPLAGGVIAQYLSVRYTFIITTSALSLVTLLSLIFIHEPKRATLKEEPSAPVKAHVGVMELLKNRPVLTVLCISTAAFLFLMLQAAILTPYVNELSGNNSTGIVLSGLVFSLQGISGAIAAPIWGIKGQHYGFYKCMIIAMLSSALFYALMGLPTTLIPFAIFEFITGLCIAGIVPMVNALLVQVTKPHERATAFGLLYSFQEGGAGSGPLIGGFIAASFGVPMLFYFGGAMLIIAACVIIICSPKALKSYTPRKL